MKKIVLTLATMLTSILAMSQFYAYKNGTVIFKMDDDVVDSITFVKPQIYKTGTIDGHDYVDLGLTSGTKWAINNIGAERPWDYGNYYSWGEVMQKSTYSQDTYKYGTDYYNALTKYCTNGSYGKDGFVDNKTVLELQDDAAHVNWGGKWRMPSKAQVEELLSECYWVWTNSYNDSDVSGYVVYKPKSLEDKGIKVFEGDSPSLSYSLFDAHIFIPASGSRVDLSFWLGTCDFWSLSLNENFSQYAYCIEGSEDGVSVKFDSRYYGKPVRAVISGE